MCAHVCDPLYCLQNAGKQYRVRCRRCLDPRRCPRARRPHRQRCHRPLDLTTRTAHNLHSSSSAGHAGSGTRGDPRSGCGRSRGGSAHAQQRARMAGLLQRGATRQPGQRGRTPLPSARCPGLARPCARARTRPHSTWAFAHATAQYGTLVLLYDYPIFSLHQPTSPPPRTCRRPISRAFTARPPSKHLLWCAPRCFSRAPHGAPS